MFLTRFTAEHRRRLASASLAVVSSALLAACEQAEQAPAQGPPPPAVTVVEIERKEVTPTAEFVGRVEAIDQVDIRARVEGFLESRNFTEGGYVSEGDKLFLIEPERYEAAVQEAQAGVARAEASLTEARLTLERLESVVERGAVAQQAVDEAAAAVLRAEAELLGEKAELRDAELDLSYTEVYAPVGGKIGRSTYTIGNLVGPSSGPLANIVSVDPVFVNFAVSERDVTERRRRRLAGEADTERPIVPRIRLSDGSDYPLAGELDFIDPRVDPATSTLTVRSIFPNPDEILVADQFVTVVLAFADPQVELVVPQAAIQRDQAGEFVLVVDGENMVEVRRVVTGFRIGTDWVIEEGLQDGERIIVEGLQKARPGAPVEPSMRTEMVEG